jgi:formylglycine-generating enzyme required for sulfatase activity
MSAYGRYEKVGSSYSTVYWDTGLSSNTAYYYKVSYYEPDRPYQPGGESGQSAAVFVRTMAANVGTAVTFTELEGNGGIYDDNFNNPLASTVTLTLTFSAPIYGLTADDITLFGWKGIQKGTLSGSGPSYTLGISGSSASGVLNVGVLKAGYNISNSMRSISYFIGLGLGPQTPGPGIGPPEMVYVPGGTFQLGKHLGTVTLSDNQYAKDVTPISNVTLSSFYIGKYPVTQAQWYAVMGKTIEQQALPSTFQDNYGRGAEYPIYFVSWYDALVFCNKLSIMEGLTPAYRIAGSTNPDDWGDVPDADNGTWDSVEVVSGSTGYRLPTEAQWEYAAKGGNPLAPGWVGYSFAGSDLFTDVGWPMWVNGNQLYSRPVGNKNPNFLGLYDMTGNVSEFCWDYNDYYTSSDKTNPASPAWTGNVTEHIYHARGIRGGLSQPSAYRDGTRPSYRNNTVGIRLARPAN